MKGVIVAGGSGTRLRPLTDLVNKHLLPVGGYPMIHYALAKMAEAGIREVLLITGKASAGLFTQYIGSGEPWEIQVTYRIQERPGGIAEAVSLAEGFIRPGDKFVVLLGDNLFEDSLAAAVSEFQEQPTGARVFLKEVPDPRRYGVPVLRDGRIVSIEEKPENPPSTYCVTGIYMYDAGVFGEIRQVTRSARGELEITDVNNRYAAAGLLQYGMLEGWWADAGTPRSLLEAGLRLMKGES
ncbi:SpsI [Paenibacillus mucilaginosus 3016]|uniref:Glucose-1-phosphate thymidylyltransferase n=2 Tax=Paenibacillus mucilaginosus TaxID=61624 RepID=H6NRR1_9BACL|nr:sugar phosphate nucleotidyltransferase [Paenibacillus mucilaginosus]AFC32797.1 SpsI [Paenibacillus mucilaginosus 3016]AFH65133.1 spore coat protein [Paenibacillus mucilaginosus K02]AFK65484.1 spore coat polysaccharide biosynthesis protein I [Paenibacillus mucilaginosus K02]WFA21259.1 spore coat protein [Paenibacillus mucilaginosus]